MNSYFCSHCHAPRNLADLDAGVSRPPCPNCGGTAITVGVVGHEYAKTTESVSTRLIPGEQQRGWKQKFLEAERELKELLAAKTTARSSDTVNAARHSLHAFYVQTYHIKDALIADATSTGLLGTTVENAITAEPTLALLADLANLDKHWTLNKPPRSGSVPVIESIGGTSSHDSQPETWRLDMVIKHAGNTLDGLQVAEEAIAAWRKLLVGWGLMQP